MKDELQIRKRFDSINGWIDLKNYNEAAEELNNLDPKFKSTTHFVKAWIRIFSATKAWTNVELMCATLLNHVPGDSFGIKHLAEALHQQGKHIDAISKLGELLSNEDRRDTPGIRYTLARYFCAAGQLKEARECLRGAIELDALLKEKSLNDPDLEKLWSNDLNVFPVQTDPEKLRQRIASHLQILSDLEAQRSGVERCGSQQEISNLKRQISRAQNRLKRDQFELSRYRA